MSQNKIQSAIKEVQDQLFLDTADGVRLTAVTANMGLTRPLRGFDDDEWRAAAKAVSFNPKNVQTAFQRVLEICEGPQYARVGTLAEDADAGDGMIVLNDADSFIQLGTIVIDPGLPTEETVEFCFRDRRTDEIYLRSPLQFAHSTNDLTDVSGLLREAIAAGATTIPLIDSSLFPTVGFPYPIIIGRGTEQEEAVVVSANDTVLNELTTTATTLDHEGPTTKFLRRELFEDAPIGRTFLQFDIGDTQEFPNEGYIVIGRNTANEEYVFYTQNDLDGNTLRMRLPLTVAHLATESVELLNTGANVDVANVWQQGIHWQIYETDPREIKVYVPESEDNILRLIDASWLHDAATQTPASTTLAAAASIGDTEIEIVSAAGFPDEASVILIGGVEETFYIFRDEDAAPNPILRLTKPLTAAYLIGATVDVVEYNYPGTNLKEGNIRDALGAIQTGRFPGPYLYDPAQRGVSLTATELATLIAPPTNVVFNQVAGYTALEVFDASQMPSPPPFQIRVGKNSGAEETTTAIDVTLRNSVSTTVVVAAFGAAQMTVTSSVGFPESSNGVNPAGYRLIIDRGGPNEEVVIVVQNDTGTGIFNLAAPLTIGHAAAETVELLFDVITTDPLTEVHVGRDLSVSELGHLVEVLYESIDLVSGAAFPPTGGIVWINFGKARVNARAGLVSIPAADTFELTSTDDFPTTDFPYNVILGEGTVLEEIASVIVNDTVLDRLQFAAPPTNAHVIGTNVRFLSGDPITIEYVDRDTDTLVFAAPTAFETRHTVGERVILSTRESLPSTEGTDYGFLMPPDFGTCLTFLFNLIRAAGVRVEIIRER